MMVRQCNSCGAQIEEYQPRLELSLVLPQVTLSRQELDADFDSLACLTTWLSGVGRQKVDI